MGILFYEHLKDLDKGIHYLNIAISEEQNATALFNLAVIYEEKGDKTKAKDLYERVGVSRYLLLFTKVLILTVKRLIFFLQVLKIDPEHFKAKVNYAILLDKEGKGDEAHNYYVEALQQNPKDARIHHNIGINMKRAGRLEDALEYYKRALDLDPENSLVFYNTGILYNILSDYQSGAEALEQSIKMNKHNTYAYLALGDALERQKEIHRAINVYKELLQTGVQVHGLKEKITYLENVL